MLLHFATGATGNAALQAPARENDQQRPESSGSASESSGSSTGSSSYDSESSDSRSEREYHRRRKPQPSEQSEEQKRLSRKKKIRTLRPVYEDYMPLSASSDHPSGYSDAERERRDSDDRPSSVPHDTDDGPLKNRKADGKKRRQQSDRDEEKKKQELIADVLRALDAGKKRSKKKLDGQTIDGKKTGAKGNPKSRNAPKVDRPTKGNGKAAKSYAQVSPAVSGKLRKTIASLGKQLSSVERKFSDLTDELGLRQ